MYHARPGRSPLTAQARLALHATRYACLEPAGAVDNPARETRALHAIAPGGYVDRAPGVPAPLFQGPSLTEPFKKSRLRFCARAPAARATSDAADVDSALLPTRLFHRGRFCRAP